MKRRSFLASVGTAGVIGLAGCSDSGSSDGGDGSGGDGSSGSDGSSGGDGGDGGSTDGGSSGTDTVTAAFVYDGRVGDQGWIYSHDRARQIIDEENDWLETTYQEEVSPEESERVMSDFVDAGADIVFTTSVVFADATLTAAENNPDAYFENANGFNTRENLARYGARVYEGRYPIGVAAGMLTETNTLGFIGGFPVPLTFRDLNAFTLGAKSVNPDITVQPTFTNEWYAPQSATTTVNDFANQDIDTVVANLDSTATVSAANDNDMWGSGIYSSMREAGGDTYISSPIASWEALYGSRCEAVRDGTWESQAVWQGVEEGLITLDDFGPNIPDDVVDAAMEARDGIVNGDVNIWEGSKFEGQSTDVGGPIETEMTTYVEGVQGTAPEN